MPRMLLARLLTALCAVGLTTRPSLAEPPPALSEYACHAPGAAGVAGRFLAEILLEKEGVQLNRTDAVPAPEKPAIILGVRSRLNEIPKGLPADFIKELETLGPEGYGILHEAQSRKAPTLWIIGADERGALFGAGRLMRERLAGEAGGTHFIPLPMRMLTSPAYAMRGHQIGFRNRANSWDAWTIDQMRAYIRDQIIFGANAIENIPFQDHDEIPLAKVTRREMNLAMSQICADYGIEHWVWTPIEFDIDKEPGRRAEELKRHAEFYREMPRLDGVFFPGGDPGDNPAAPVIAFMEETAGPLTAAHPGAKIWLSMQSFKPSDQTAVYDWANTRKPDWFGGIVYGPSSPPVRESRARLDRKYKIRAYPDLTHTVRCQYPVPNWDRAFNLTLGRECINYRPAASIYIHNLYAPWTDGFISYSDGVHDDANKAVWSLAAWDPAITAREAMIQYERCFNGGDNSEAVADALLALEKNWEGPIVENGAIDATAMMWIRLSESSAGPASTNWRMQMARFRAWYDRYQRHRQIRETGLQTRADEILRSAPESGATAAMARAKEILAEPLTDASLTEARSQVVDLAQALFDSIQLQTSVEKYKASGAERGCSLDFIDHPLNDRRYYEYRFKEIEALADEKEKIAQLLALADWTNPGPGGFYDDIGNIGASPRALVEKPWRHDPQADDFPNTEFTWSNNGNDLRRLSWQDWQAVDAMRYTGLDTGATYRVVATMGDGPLTKAKGMIRVTANGKEAQSLDDPPMPSTPKTTGKFGGAFVLKAWRIPAGSFPEGELRVEWIIKGSGKEGRPVRHPELAEVWLVREP